MNFSFELEDFDRYPWKEIIETSEIKTYTEYARQYMYKEQECRENNDGIGANIFKFLTILLIHTSQLSSYKKRDPNLLSYKNLEILKKLIPQIQDSEMKAKVADVFFSLKIETQKMGEGAIQSYIKSARRFEDKQHENSSKWYYTIKRASQIATRIDGKKKTIMTEKIVNYIDNLITHHSTHKHEFFTRNGMRILQEELEKSLKKIKKENFDNYVKNYALIAKQKAIDANSLQNHHRAQTQKEDYYEIAKNWYKILKDKDAEREMAISLAEADVWYATKRIENEKKPYGTAASLVKSAIKALRKVEDTFGKQEDTSQRIEDLHKKMLEYQKIESETEVVHYVFKIVDNEMPIIKEATQESVKGKSLDDALSFLAQQNIIPNIDLLKETAKKNIEKDTLSDVLHKTYVDDKGKAKAVQRTQEEDRLKDEMFNQGKMSHSMSAGLTIEFACEQICSEHIVNVKDIYSTIKNSPFIPRGREFIYAQGLSIGLEGDLVVCTHLLIPQLENSLRHILQENGFITSNLTSQMLQDEYSLNKIFDKHYGNLSQILSEDTVFSLQGLLVERRGSNLRNDVCHGLYDYEKFEEGLMSYLWWLTLHLCLTYEKL